MKRLLLALILAFGLAGFSVADFYSPSTSDHGALSGLADDDHTQYALLAGRSGGQTVKGDTASAGNLTLVSTNHATKGKINLGAAATSYWDEANKALRLGYDGSFYADLSVGSDGKLTIAQAGGDRIAIGYNASATTGTGNLAIGRSAAATTADYVTALGYDAQSTGEGGVAIGASSRATALNAIGIGLTAHATGIKDICIGGGIASGGNSILIGHSGPASTANGSVSLGFDVQAATGQYGICIGYQSSCTANQAIAMGVLAVADEANSMVLGADGFPISNLYGGAGRLSATPTSFAIQASGGTGTDIAGGTTIVAGGKGTGAGTPGAVQIKVPVAGSTGTTLQTLGTVATFVDSFFTQTGTSKPTFINGLYTTTTTDATVTTISTIATASNTVTRVEAMVTGRRTGGTSGSAGDSAGYSARFTFKNIGGTLTQVGSLALDANEDQAGWDVTVTTSGTNILVKVTGAADNNVTWDATVRTSAGQ